MKKLKYISFLLLIIILTSCSKFTESDEESKNNNDETINFSLKIDLFNSIEKMINQISDKKYSDAYESIEEVYELTNKVGIIYDDNSEGANYYIDTLNDLTKLIREQSDSEKIYKVTFDYQKSMLELISNSTNNSGGQGSDEGQQSSSSTNSSNNSTQSNKVTGETSSSDTSNQGEQKQDTEQVDLSGEESSIIIPEEVFLSSYPELTITQSDLNIKNKAIDLLNYVSSITLLSNPENNIAIINRQKYLFYKLESIGKLNQYGSVDIIIDEAKKNWETLYLNYSEENNKDILTINTIINNIETALNKRNPIAVEIQIKSAIETLETLSNKSKINNSN